MKVLAPGSCVITVSTTDGSNLSAQCAVTALAGIDDIFAEDAPVDVYNMNGILVKKGATRSELKQLIPGAYILRSGNTVVKTIVK